jgi:hypothetical protein
MSERRKILEERIRGLIARVQRERQRVSDLRSFPPGIPRQDIPEHLTTSYEEMNALESGIVETGKDVLEVPVLEEAIYRPFHKAARGDRRIAFAELHSDKKEGDEFRALLDHLAVQLRQTEQFLNYLLTRLPE